MKLVGDDKEKIVHSWSGGKDSSISLYRLLKSNLFKPSYLLTTATIDFQRVSMHGIRLELLYKQAESLGLPVQVVYLSKNSSNEEYERKMREALLKFKLEGIKKVSFGDIFLEDIRKYREQKLSELDMEGIFPIWGEDTRKLSNQIIDLGFKAIVCTVDSRKLDKSFAGKDYDNALLESIPGGVDPCGEYGEFHTFVYDGPIFRKRINFKVGETVLRDGFYFVDLIPV